MNKKWRELKDKMQIATYKDISLIFDALIEKEKHGQLCPETMRKIKVYNDYYKEKIGE